MTSVVNVDLDDPDTSALERLDSELRRRRAVRSLDPSLRADVLRATDEAVDDGRLDTTEADQIRQQLDQMHPAVVLEQWGRKLIKDRPALGAFPSRNIVKAPSPDEWIRQDPRRLAGIVLEAARFGSDLKAIAVAVLELADGLGIEEATADEIVAAAFHNLRHGGRHAG